MPVLASTLRALADVLEAEPVAGEPDALVAFPFGLERKAAAQVIKRGLLVSAKLGRKVYAKRSAVVALVDVVQADKKTKPRRTKKETDRETYRRLVRGT